MADVFADLIANIRIDTANFDRQLATVKSQLSGFSAASLGNITLKNLEAELDNINNELIGTENVAKGSAENIQGGLDKINTKKARSELELLSSRLGSLEKDQKDAGTKVVLDSLKLLKAEDGVDPNLIQESIKSGIKDYDTIGKKIEETTKQIKKTTTATEDLGKKGKKATKEVEVGFSGIVGKALKAVAVMGTVELALGVLNAAADIASGDLDSAVEGLKRLPAGIGPVVTQLESFLGTVTGLTASTEAWTSATAAGLEALSKQLDSTEKAALGLNSVFAQEMDNQKLLAELRLRGTEEGEKGIKQLNANFNAAKRLLDLETQIQTLRLANSKIVYETGSEETERQQRIREIKEELEKEAKGLKQNPFKQIESLAGPAKERVAALQTELASLDQISKARQTILQTNLKEIKILEEQEEIVEKINIEEDRAIKREAALEKQEEITKAIKERSDAMLSVQDAMSKAREEAKKLEAKAREEAKKLEAKAREEKFKEEGKIAKRIADLQLGIQQKTLQAQGKDLEAQTLGLQRKLQGDLAGAIRPGGLKEAALLFKNFQLDLGALDNEEQKNKTDIRSRFEDTLAQLTVADRDSKIARQQEKQERRDDQRNEILTKIKNANEDMKEILRKNPGIAVFG